jgi:hypothetical protein
MLPGILLIALWTRLRTGKVSLHSPLAEGPGNPREQPSDGRTR